MRRWERQPHAIAASSTPHTRGAETVEAEIFDCPATALVWLPRGQRDEMTDARAALRRRAHSQRQRTSPPSLNL